MGYRKVSAMEQIWYIIKFSIINKLEGLKCRNEAKHQKRQKEKGA